MEELLALADLSGIQYLCFKLVKFLLGLTATMTVVTLVTQVFTFGYFGEAIGLVSMGIEAMLGIPQAYSNWSRKSVEGLSIKMIGMWFLGDFAKTCYFIIEVLFLSLSASPSSSCSAEWSNSPWTSSSSPRSSTTARPTTTKSNTSQIQLQNDPHSLNSDPALIQLSSKSIICITSASPPITGVELANLPPDPLGVLLTHLLVHLNQILNIPRTVLEELLFDRSLLEVVSPCFPEYFLHPFLQLILAKGGSPSLQDLVETWSLGSMNGLDDVLLAVLNVFVIDLSLLEIDVAARGVEQALQFDAHAAPQCHCVLLA